MEYSVRNMYYCYKLRAAGWRVVAKTTICKGAGIRFIGGRCMRAISMRSFWLATSKAER